MADPAPTRLQTTQERQQAAPGATRALILLLLLNCFNYIDRQVLPAVEKDIRGEFGLTDTQSGMLGTAFMIVYMVTAPVFGLLADRVSRWLLVAIGIFIQALATGGSGLATGFAMLLVMRCVVGVGDAAYGPAAPTLIADLYPRSMRGRKLSWFYAAIPVGSAIGYMVGGSMLSLTGSWRSGFFVIVPPMILLGVICLFMRDPHRKAAADPARPVRKLTWADYATLARNRSYVLAAAGMTLMTFAIGGMAFWMPTYLREDRGLTPFATGVGFGGVIAASGLLATLAGGWAGDALRARFSGSYFLVSGVSMLIAAPCMLLILVVDFPLAWVVVFLTCFFVFFNTGPSNTIIANVTHPSIRASAFALNIFIIHALGDAISPVIIGAIADRYDRAWGFVLMAFMLFAGGVVWLCGVPHLARDTVEEAHPLQEGDAPPAP